MTSRIDAIKDSIRRSVKNAGVDDRPYRHWQLLNLLPEDVYREVRDISFPLFDLEGVSGTREIHNKSRRYFDAANQEAHEAARDVAAALQDPETVALFRDAFGARLDDSLLRIEFAQDTDGFWLEPHTDIGVKMFTMLHYLSDEPGQENLGTDIYADKETRVGRSPFVPNSAMVFIPAENTWHGFEQRPIPGVRKSMIVNYVTHEWRAREQLAFPDRPVHAA